VGDPDIVCWRIGQDTLTAERAHRLSAWWQAARPLHNKCKDCTVAWAFREARTVGLCYEPQATRPLQVSARAGSVGKGLDTCRHRTLACAGVLSVPGPRQGSDLTQGDPVCIQGSSKLALTGVRCSSVEIRTQRCFVERIILPRHVVPLGLPMWWGRVPLSV
jgi:hypothetical protein